MQGRGATEAVRGGAAVLAWPPLTSRCWSLGAVQRRPGQADVPRQAAKQHASVVVGLEQHGGRVL